MISCHCLNCMKRKGMIAPRWGTCAALGIWIVYLAFICWLAVQS